MNQKNLFFIGAIIAIMAFLFFKEGDKKKVTSDESEIETEVEQTTPVEPPVGSEDVAVASATTQVSTDTTLVFAENIPSATLPEVVKKNYARHMAALEKCLKMNNVASAAGEDLNQEALVNSIKSNIGEVVVQLDDWTQWDLVDKTGVKKRVRVDITYPDGATPSRRLSVFTVNAYGALEFDNLTNDQSDNPNLAYIESLKEDAQMLVDEKSTRMYFGMGEELLLSTKNGHLDSISLARGDRVFSCANLAAENSTCTCP